MGNPSEVRIDKWLWAVRVYKTRSLATQACRAGHVKVESKVVKPSHCVKFGEVITAQLGLLLRTVKVLALLDRRVGAKVVAQFMEDLTPPEEYQKPRDPQLRPLFERPKGAGRPTKKDRRLLNPFLKPSSANRLPPA